MLGLDILEVAIGMAFLYVLMSLIASALREAIEGFMKTRAVDLERGIVEMLRTDTTKRGGGADGLIYRPSGILPIWLTGGRSAPPSASDSMAAKLYAHPLVSSLYRGNYEEARRYGMLPSYIPRESFATALLDLVAGASETGKQLSITSLAAALGPTPNAVQRVVLTALSTAHGNLDAARHAIEAWYDATNDRVASWYKRRTGYILFFIGLGAAIVLNVDSVTIAKALWTDPLLRKAIVEQADAYAKANANNPNLKTPATDAAKDSSNPTGKAKDAKQNGAANKEPAQNAKPEDKAGAEEPGTAEATGGNETEATVDAPSAAKKINGKADAASAKQEETKAAAGEQSPQAKSIEELRKELSGVGFPVGWSLAKDGYYYPTRQGGCILKPDGQGNKTAEPPKPELMTTCKVASYPGMLLFASIGWLITAIAVMLGAPFWFDLLNKFISLRTAMKPPELKRTKTATK